MFQTAELLVEFFKTPLIAVPFDIDGFGILPGIAIPADWVVEVLHLPYDITIGQLLFGVGLVAVLTIKIRSLVLKFVVKFVV